MDDAVATQRGETPQGVEKKKKCGELVGELFLKGPIGHLCIIQFVSNL